ncbi:MAG: alpha/beta hydrolase [Bacteroidota bacterium]|nr:alpha/beta hydrolase [Bacteroidota bacterium]
MNCKTTDELNIYYEIQGNVNAPETLIFLNGLTQSTLAWFFCLPFFKDHYKIVLMDFIFQGNSDKTGEPRNFDQHAEDVISVLNHENISKVSIVGLSYGSLVAQHLAVNYPQKINKLILLSTFAHKTPFFEAIELSWWRSLEIGGYGLMFDTMMPYVLGEDYFSKPIIPIEILKKSREDLNQNAQAIFNLMRATKERDDYRPELKKIKAPTLIIQGEKDTLLPVYLANEVQKHISGSTLQIIKGAGHTLNLERVPEVCTNIFAFLSAKN